jgi:hypothetical protein
MLNCHWLKLKQLTPAERLRFFVGYLEHWWVLEMKCKRGNYKGHNGRGHKAKARDEGRCLTRQ